MPKNSQQKHKIKNATPQKSDTNPHDKNLQSLRTQIDKIDEQILDLLESRLSIVKKIGENKLKNNASIYRPEREREIIKRLSVKPLKYLNINAIEAIYHEIFAISRNLELPQKVAYLGPLGSYTHQAAALRFGALSESLPINTISAIFKALQSNQTKYAVMPIEKKANNTVII